MLFFEGLENLNLLIVTTYIKLYFVVLVVFGLVSLFYGYKIMRFLIGIYGAIFSFTLYSVRFNSLVTSVLLALVTGILFFKYHKLFTVISYGFLFYVIVAIIFFLKTGLDEVLVHRLSISIGFSLAIIMIMFNKQVTIVITSLSGAIQAVTGFLALIAPVLLPNYIYLVLFLILLILGMRYQFKDPYDYDLD